MSKQPEALRLAHWLERASVSSLRSATRTVELRYLMRRDDDKNKNK